MTHGMLGWIPRWLDEDDPDPAWKQIDKHYQHGGGWHPGIDPKLTINKALGLCYPEDPIQPLLAKCQLRDETILFYPHAFVAIMQKDGSYEICRVD